MDTETEKMEKTEETTEVTETTTDQHGSAIPEGFGDAVDKALETEETEEVEDEEITEEVSEDTDNTEVETEVEEKTSEEVEKPVEKEATKAQETEKSEERLKEKPQEIEDIKFDLDAEIVDPQIKAAIDSIAVTLTEQRKEIAVEKESLRLEREKVFENRIDKCFDSFSEDLTDLGSSSSLTEQNGKYRREIFQHAHVASQIHGISIEEAIKNTVQMFKNKDGEKTTEKRLITKLNKQKKTFTNTPTRKKSSPQTRKFKNETDKANFIMDEAYKEAGIET